MSAHKTPGATVYLPTSCPREWQGFLDPQTITPKKTYYVYMERNNQTTRYLAYYPLLLERGSFIGPR